MHFTKGQLIDCSAVNCNQQYVVNESNTNLDMTFYCAYPSNCNSNMVIYFAGKSLLISCQGFNSCQGLTVYCGTFNPSVPEFDETKMDDNNVTCSISCELTGSCSDINMYCNGDNVNDCNIKNPLVSNGMTGSTIECSNINKNNNCGLNCTSQCSSTNNLTCHGESSCSCYGQCASVNKITITLDPTTNIPTSSPNTASPTTMFPTSNPNTAPPTTTIPTFGPNSAPPTTMFPTSSPNTAPPTMFPATQVNMYINITITIETNMTVNDTKIMFEHVLSIALSDIEYKLEFDVISKDNDISTIKLIIYSSEIIPISKDQLLRDLSNNLISIYNVHIISDVETTLFSAVSTYASTDIFDDSKSNKDTPEYILIMVITIMLVIIIAVLIFTVYHFKCKKRDNNTSINKVKSIENEIETDSKCAVHTDDIEMVKKTNDKSQNIQTCDVDLSNSSNTEDLFTKQKDTHRGSDDDINDMYQTPTQGNGTTTGDTVTNDSNIITTQGDV